MENVGISRIGHPRQKRRERKTAAQLLNPGSTLGDDLRLDIHLEPGASHYRIELRIDSYSYSAGHRQETGLCADGQISLRKAPDIAEHRHRAGRAIYR